MTPDQNNMKSQYFRASVGAVIINGEGKVLAFDRRDIPGAWQLPQGGIEVGEEPIDAIKREVLEETGIKQDDLALIRKHPAYLTYELPHEYRSEKTGRGQTQQWFLFRYSADESQIQLSENGEFIAWGWMPFQELIKKAVSFRKEVYRQIAAEFSEIQRMYLMSIEDDPLYEKVIDSYDKFKKEAKKHKRLNRMLWWAASAISVGVAITATLDIVFKGNNLQTYSAILALILPLVTGYVVMRTPEKLWILETSTRNCLKDLSDELEFEYTRNPEFDRKPFEKRYLEIMADASSKWVKTKQGTG